MERKPHKMSWLLAGLGRAGGGFGESLAQAHLAKSGQ